MDSLFSYSNRDASDDAPGQRPATALDALRTVFGYDSFRGQQADIIDHVVRGGDALVLMPTGGGKSLCYQIPALVRDGVTVVVSPLIALMRDQVTALRELGVRAAFLNSSLGPAEAREVERAMVQGEIDLVYVAPERLVTPRFLDLLDRTRLALFALDEAHCVSQWGHDFRPEYLQLSILHERHPMVPRIALTATADVQTRAEIKDKLGLTDARVFLSSFDRPNITYRVVPKKSERQQMLAFLRENHPEDAGIVYCMSRNKVEEVAAWLNQQGREALPYHAGLPAETREANQDRFIKSEGLVMVATVAFGMGIDKPNVRFVCHLDPPKSLEAYYQETGRAGRDGLPSDAFMTYGMQDMVQRRRMIDEGDAPEEVKRIERRKLEALLAVCETVSCRRQALLKHFGEDHPGNCGGCDACLDPADTWDGTESAIKLLAAIYRTGQRFGAGHIIDVLVGKETEKVLMNGHHNQPVFGKGDEFTPKAWQSVIRQLTAQGLIVVDTAGFGSLRLGEGAREVFRHERKVILRKDQPRKAEETKRALSKAVELPEPAASLFELLRAERSKLAKSQGVPPYVIFHDSTLRAMAVARPASLSEMDELPGMGSSKLERYGRAFLDIIASA